jgi:hypothetical protein
MVGARSFITREPGMDTIVDDMKVVILVVPVVAVREDITIVIS